MTTAGAPHFTIYKDAEGTQPEYQVQMPTCCAGPSRPFRVWVCAARTLNATGQSRVTLSLR